MSLLLVIPTVVDSTGVASGGSEATGFSSAILSSLAASAGQAQALGLAGSILGSLGSSEGQGQAFGLTASLIGSIGSAQGFAEAFGHGQVLVQRAMVCAMRGVYTLICRDPETASGGIDPVNVELHAPGFYRTDREELEFLTGQSIDRRVQVMADGTPRFTALRIGQNRLRTFGLTIRVGYFLGDHFIESMDAMADDDSLILRTLSKQENWPDCRGITNVQVTGSRRVRLDSTRQILEVYVELQVA